MISQTKPSGWAETTLGDICDKPEYGWTTKAATDKGGLKLLRTSDISKGSINWSTVPFCEQEPPTTERFLLADGDIVISRAGSVGLSALIYDCPRAVFASYLIRFRSKKGFDKRYLHYYLSSPSYWEQISQGIGRHRPPKRERQEIGWNNDPPTAPGRAGAHRGGD